MIKLNKTKQTFINSIATKKGSALWVTIEFVFIVVTMVFFTCIFEKWLVAQIPVLTTSQKNQTGLKHGTNTTIGHINILLLGVDSVEGTHRSDTILIMGVNIEKAKISLLSVPRDTRVLIGGRARKINEVLPRYGEQSLRNLLEDLMHIKINRYVKVDFQGFKNIIDIIGGLDVFVERTMNYDDNWGKLHIHFKKGLHHMSGEQALEYVRFRKDVHADLGRIKRQQQFIKVLIKKAMTPIFFVKLPKVIKEAFKHIHTDFTLPELFLLASSFHTTKIELKSASMPGEARYIDKISYFLPYKDKAIEIGQTFFSDLAALEITASFTNKVIATGSANAN